MPENFSQKQLFFRWDQAPPQTSHAEGARSESPPGDNSRCIVAIDLVRPDRQICYPDAESHFDWPSADNFHDRDTITVDRIGAQGTTPPHRFVVRRGDTVSVHLGHQRSDIGTVTGISHTRNEVSIRFADGTVGVWFAKGAIYPARDVNRTENAHSPQSRSKNIELLNASDGGANVVAVGIEGTSIAPVSSTNSHQSTEPPTVTIVTPERQQPAASDASPKYAFPTTPSASVLARQVLDYLGERLGVAVPLQVLLAEFGQTILDATDLDAHPIHQALQKLRNNGQVHWESPRWGQAVVSVLAWPQAPEQWTRWVFPDTLTGAEIIHLMHSHQVTIRDLAARMQIPQKRIREVRDGKGLCGRHTVRDWVEAIAKPPVPGGIFSLEDHTRFLARAGTGDLTVAEWQSDFERMLASRTEFIAQLVSTRSAPQLKSWAVQLGDAAAGRNTKYENARSVYRRLLQMFLITDGLRYDPMRETAEEAVAREVRAITPERLDGFYKQRGIDRAAHEKALSQPETLDEFREFVRHRGVAKLTDEQLCLYDVLLADLTREKRRSDKLPNTVEKLSNDLADQQLRITVGFHTKRQCPLWTVKLSDRVDRTAFLELKGKAQQLGGWYSSFVKSQTGFQFLSRESAEKFVALLNSDQDRTAELHDRHARQHQTAAERLTLLAMELHQRAEETIVQSQSARQNTMRRADMQAGIRGRAHAEQALARTITQVATVLNTGHAKYLDGLRHKSHVEVLQRLAKQSKTNHLRHKCSVGRVSPAERDAAYDRPVSLADLRFVTYPYPTIWKTHLHDATLKSARAQRAKLACQRMSKRLRSAKEDFVRFETEHDVEELADFLSRVQAAGHDTEWMDHELADYKRLRAADIHTLPELRAALREFLPLFGLAPSESPIALAERELIGKPLPGFFPTPPSIVRQLLAAARIEPQHRILEPSVGKGDIADAIRREFPTAYLIIIEINQTLADVLTAKGYEPIFGDFLQFSRGESFDRILMNPPFERGLDIDHVQHAYAQLAPQGRLVAIMSEGPYFRSDKKAENFRDWLQEVGGTNEILPDDAFAGKDAFRQTAVRTRMVIIDKSRS